MIFIDRLFGAAYSYNVKVKSGSPTASAIISIAFIFELQALLCLEIINKILHLELMKNSFLKPAVVIALGIILFIFYKYYNKIRIEKIISDFDNLPATQKGLWQVSFLLLMVLPIGLMIYIT